MLLHWADEIIMPSWTEFYVDSEEAANAADTFALNLDSATFEVLRSKYQTAHSSWQKVSLFEIGPGEQRNIRLCNTYPTDTLIVKGSSESYDSNNPPNLTLPSTFTQQGFPALDYLLLLKEVLKINLNTIACIQRWSAIFNCFFPILQFWVMKFILTGLLATRPRL